MPYKDLAAFRRSYRTKEGCFAHKRSHNLLRDYKEYQSVKDVLKDEAPKTLAKFQELKYNNSEQYKQVKREQTTITKVKNKGWTQDFIDKAISLYYDLRKKGIEATDHGLARILSRNIQIADIVQIHQKPFNYCQPDGKKIKFYNHMAIIYTDDEKEIVSVIKRKTVKDDWNEI